MVSAAACRIARPGANAAHQGHFGNARVGRQMRRGDPVGGHHVKDSRGKQWPDEFGQS